VSDPRAVAAVAALLGDESRAAMCLAMLDGGGWTVSELAEQASVGVAAASEHVHRLAAAGLVSPQVQGRCKYVRLAGPDVAALLETLSRFGSPTRADSLSAVRERRRFATARTCYDHLAGRLGVHVFDALVHRRLLRNGTGLAITGRGRQWFSGLVVSLDELERGHRPLVRDCIDVTERRPHLAGAVGAGLCAAFEDQQWVRRYPGSRALEVTPLGERVLADELGIRAGDLVPR
jgi:DNA-binding transcriptional ArsR family regulator